MANINITPNMGLPNPVPGIDPGPDYASNIQTSLNIVDQHNHTSGNGVQIPSGGLNINGSLPFNNNTATTLKGLVFTQQPSLATLNAIFVGTDGNLYFNDGAGDPSIQITAGGLVNATSSGISSGTATASFVSSVLVVNAASNTPANIQGGSILLGNNSSGSKFLTLAPPAAMGSNIQITFPQPPASTQVLTMDSSGNMGTSLQITQGVNPSGAIIMWGGVSAPTGYLLCDGSAVSRTSYANLFSAIGTANGIGDGSTTFNLPDMRGQFPRGVTGASANDPDASSRTAINGGNSGNNVGSVQGYQVQSHTHTAQHQTNSQIVAGGGTFVFQANSGNTGSTGGNETRPTNIYVNFIIKT